MPWSETNVMEQRIQFIQDWLKRTHRVSDLCALYGISRKSGVSDWAWHLESWSAGADDGVHQRTRCTPCKRQSGACGAITRSS